MERERNTDGMQKVLTGIFALVIAGIIVVLGGFVMRRLGEMKDVCAEGVGGVEIGNVCGGENE